MAECAREGVTDLNCGGSISGRITSGGSYTEECEVHRNEILDRLAKINEVYPDSSFPPDWFTPIDGTGMNEYGERWEDD